MSTSAKAPLPSDRRAAARARPVSDDQDHEDATRGLIVKLEPCVIRVEDGRVVWDNDFGGQVGAHP
jgi:alkyl sulfatase BDS1-like metallo-beta-lactamase superfamily hydrolase